MEGIVLRIEKPEQQNLDLDCEDEWNGMPEFCQEDLTPWHQVNVRFRNQEDFDRFKQLMEQEVTPKQKTLWFPYAPFRRASKFKYIDDES
jgi:hypothetical protein